MQNDDIKYAGFWRRMAASFLDLPFFIPNFLIISYLEGISPLLAGLSFILAQVYVYAYTLGLTYRYGGTIGKLAIGIRIRPADGGELTWSNVWRRSAVDMLLAIVIIASEIFGMTRIDFPTYAAAGILARSDIMNAAIPWLPTIGLLYMMWMASEFVVLMTNRRRRALHDFIAGTVVVVVRRQSATQVNPRAVLPVSGEA